MERSGAHNQLGLQGETLAADFLVAKGYQLLERNLNLKIGEIDLLFEDGQTVVLVEVKTLRIARHFNPLEKIDWAKQKKLQLLSLIVSARYPERNVRVDAVTIYWLTGINKPIINHLENILQ